MAKIYCNVCLLISSVSADKTYAKESLMLTCSLRLEW